MSDDSPPRWATIASALNQKGALDRCPACSLDVPVQVLTANDKAKSELQVDGTPPPSIKSLETIKIACLNCGFIREHLVQYAEGPGVVTP